MLDVAYKASRRKRQSARKCREGHPARHYGLEGRATLRRYKAFRALAAASAVRWRSSSEWAVEMKPASNCDGAEFQHPAEELPEAAGIRPLGRREVRNRTGVEEGCEHGATGLNLE